MAHFLTFIDKTTNQLIEKIIDRLDKLSSEKLLDVKTAFWCRTSIILNTENKTLVSLYQLIEMLKHYLFVVNSPVPTGCTLNVRTTRSGDKQLLLFVGTPKCVIRRRTYYIEPVNMPAAACMART